MAKKKRNDYFELLTNQSVYCVKAAEMLNKIVCNFDAHDVMDYYNNMHEIEKSADVLHHDILSSLLSIRKIF